MTECPICLEIIQSDNMHVVECCNMTFCITCLTKWFNINNEITCPICHNTLDNYYIPIAVVDNSENLQWRPWGLYNIKYIVVCILFFLFVKIIFA